MSCGCFVEGARILIGKTVENGRWSTMVTSSHLIPVGSVARLVARPCNTPIAKLRGYHQASSGVKIFGIYFLQRRRAQVLFCIDMCLPHFALPKKNTVQLDVFSWHSHGTFGTLGLYKEEWWAIPSQLDSALCTRLDCFPTNKFHQYMYHLKSGLTEGERKLRFILAWKHDVILMGYAECLEPWQDLSPWPSASNTASKCTRSLGRRERGGSSEESLCWTQTCPSPCWSMSNSS